MFRRRFQATGGGLPTSSGGGGEGSSSVFNLGGGGSADGSARSIHLQAPLVTKWQRSSRAVKISYMVALISLFVVIMGWRSLSYYSARLYVECTSTDCVITVRGVGGKAIKLAGIPRHQLLGGKAVKVNSFGTVVNLEVNLNEEWKYEDHSKKKKKGNSNNYKGPDKDGNYLTYVLMLKNKDLNGKLDLDNNSGGDVNEQVEKPVDLAPIMPFMFKPGTGNEYYIVFRQYGITQSRRRVRTMVQKVDSYAKRRRHKLTVKENTSPDWKAVLMLVLGSCACLVSLVMGIFWEDDDALVRHNAGGPGARRRQQAQQQQRNLNNSKSSSTHTSNPYQRSMPSKYEVSTLPSKRNSSASMRRRN